MTWGDEPHGRIQLPSTKQVLQLVALVAAAEPQQVAAVLESSNCVWVLAWPSGRLSSLLTGHLGNISCPSACPTLPHTIAAGSRECPALFRLPTLVQPCVPACCSPCACLCLHHPCITSTADDGTERVWDLRSGAATHELIGSSTSVSGLALCEDQARAAVSGAGHKTEGWLEGLLHPAAARCGAAARSSIKRRPPASSCPAAGRVALLLRAGGWRGDPRLGPALPRALPVRAGDWKHRRRATAGARAAAAVAAASAVAPSAAMPLVGCSPTSYCRPPADPDRLQWHAPSRSLFASTECAYQDRHGGMHDQGTLDGYCWPECMHRQSDFGHARDAGKHLLVRYAFRDALDLSALPEEAERDEDAGDLSDDERGVFRPRDSPPYW